MHYCAKYRNFSLFLEVKILWEDSFHRVSGDTRALRQNFQTRNLVEITVIYVVYLNPLSVNLTKWSNRLKQFCLQQPTNCLSVLTFLWGWHLKGQDLIGLT